MRAPGSSTPASSPRMTSATRRRPGCGQPSCTCAAYASAAPRTASSDSAVTGTEARRSSAMSRQASAASPSVAAFELMKASASAGRSGKRAVDAPPCLGRSPMSHSADNVAVQPATVDRYGRLAHGRTRRDGTNTTILTSKLGNESRSSRTIGPPLGRESLLIKFDGVTKRYPDGTVAVDDLTLEIPSGQITVFVGPSGCGKTTSLRKINRMIDPTSGTISIDGEDIRKKNPSDLRRGIGYVIQHAGLFPHRTIVDNIATVPYLLGWDKKKARATALELLERVGLDA